MKNVRIAQNVFQKSVFSMNLLFVVLAIIIFHFKLTLQYFFYALIISTFILSFLSFNIKKECSKGIILTNLFVFFYFLYPYIAQFLYGFLEQYTIYVLIAYTLTLGSILLELSGKREVVFLSFKLCKFKYILVLIPVAIIFGILFNFLGEPIPQEILINSSSISLLLVQILILSLCIGVSEQLLFTGFLYNTYSSLSKPIFAQLQTAILFVFFHMLEIGVLVLTFSTLFGSLHLLYLVLYVICLFIFMNIAIMLFRGFSINVFGKVREIKGSLTYSILFHIIVDFTLMTLVMVL